MQSIYSIRYLSRPKAAIKIIRTLILPAIRALPLSKKQKLLQLISMQPVSSGKQALCILASLDKKPPNQQLISPVSIFGLNLPQPTQVLKISRVPITVILLRKIIQKVQPTSFHKLLFLRSINYCSTTKPKKAHLLTLRKTQRTKI